MLLPSPALQLRGLVGSCFSPVCLPSFRRPLSRGVEGRLAEPLVGEQFRNLGAISTPGRARGPPGLLQDGGLERLLLTFPLRAVFEQVLASLDLVLAPPALGVRESCRPLEVLAGKAVSRLELVECTSYICPYEISQQPCLQTSRSCRIG